MNWTEMELRWVLLGLGLLVVVGVYLGGILRSRSKPSDSPRSEPDVWPAEMESVAPLPETGDLQESSPDVGETGRRLADASVGDVPSDPRSAEGHEELPAEPPTDRRVADTERVVSLRLIPKEGAILGAEQTIRALRAAGLQHGPFDIFHYCKDQDVPESGFSVANLVEPGSFDLSDPADSTIPGMTFFLALPGSGDPVRRFDKMVDVARGLSQSLDAKLVDDAGNSWSIQRERFLREELIEYQRRRFST